MTEADIDRILDRPRSFELRAHVVASFERFRAEVREHYTPLFEKLAEDQNPHTLFIGCVDSRVTPAMLTGSHPGELFVVRRLGAIVIPPNATTVGGEAAAIEYAVGVLGVRNIVVCGTPAAARSAPCAGARSQPACTACRAGWPPPHRPRAIWSRPISTKPHAKQPGANWRTCARFPQVQAALESGTLLLHAWFYDVGRAELYEWREEQQTFAVLRDGESTGS